MHYFPSCIRFHNHALLLYSRYMHISKLLNNYTAVQKICGTLTWEFENFEMNPGGSVHLEEFGKGKCRIIYFSNFIHVSGYFPALFILVVQISPDRGVSLNQHNIHNNLKSRIFIILNLYIFQLLYKFCYKYRFIAFIIIKMFFL